MSGVWRVAVAMALVAAWAEAGAPRTGDEAVEITQFPESVVVYVKRLDALRRQCKALSAEVRLTDNAGAEAGACRVDLTMAAQPPAIVLMKKTTGAYRTVAVTLKGDGRVLLEKQYELPAVVTPKPLVAPLLEKVDLTELKEKEQEKKDMPEVGALDVPDIKRDAPEETGQFGELKRATRKKEKPKIVERVKLSAIEPASGAKADPEKLPRIELPDPAKFEKLVLGPAGRVLKLADITHKVVTETNYPLVGSNNNVAISFQTAFPGDATRRSIYITLKSEIFDPETGRPVRNAHWMVEVPLDAKWLAGPADEVVNLPPKGVRVHASEKTAPGWKNRPIPILGEELGGLGQLVGSMAVDRKGNIYYSTSVPTGIVRFNVSRGEWETPPVKLTEFMNNYLPTNQEAGKGLLKEVTKEKKEKVELPDEFADLTKKEKKEKPPAPQPVEKKQGSRLGHWHNYWIIASGGDRLFFAPIITFGSPGRYSFAGVFSAPIDDWDDAKAFERGLRFHVGSWPWAKHSLYLSLPSSTSDTTRKLGFMRAYGNRVVITSYADCQGGPWRLDLDDEWNVKAFGNLNTFKDNAKLYERTDGVLPPQSAGWADFSNYGEIRFPRESLGHVLTGKRDESLKGTVRINYDAVAALRAQPAGGATILKSISGASLGPAWMATGIPLKPGHVLAAAEYGYYLSDFDVSKDDGRAVRKTYLNLDVGAGNLALPIAVGLGPYSTLWVDEGEKQWVYWSGYTGIVRMLYAIDGKPLARFRMEKLDGTLLKTAVLDNAGGGGIKRYRYMVPGIDNRIFLTGTHTAARAGTAWSGGLMSFKTTTLGELEKLSDMSRSYNTTVLRSRLVYEPDGRAVQQLYLRGSYNAQYAFELPFEKVPENKDPKLFLYECRAGGAPKDLFGFSLPALTDQAFSRDRHYLIVLAGNNLLTFDVATQRFVDGKRLAGPAGTLSITYLFRPDQRLIRTPDDRLLFYAVPDEKSKAATFYEVRVDPAGRISVAPLATIEAESAAALEETFKVVRVFLPDGARGDGSYDLFLGVQFRRPESVVRVIRDFIPAGRH